MTHAIRKKSLDFGFARQTLMATVLLSVIFLSGLAGCDRSQNLKGHNLMPASKAAPVMTTAQRVRLKKLTRDMDEVRQTLKALPHDTRYDPEVFRERTKTLSKFLAGLKRIPQTLDTANKDPDVVAARKAYQDLQLEMNVLYQRTMETRLE